MSSTSIYSNLSLQVLKLKNVDFNYDEYFNFDLNIDSKLSVFVIFQSIKPLLDIEIFTEFIRKNIDHGKKTAIISDDINFFKIVFQKLYMKLVFPISFENIRA